MTAQAKSERFTEVVLAIFRTNGALLEWGDRFVSPHGITSARWQIIGAIGLAGQPLTAPKIASTMGISRQGAQKQLNLLLTDKLVEQIPNPLHQRSPLYRLNDAGAELYRAIEKQWNDAAARLANAVPAADLDKMQALLEQICRLLAGNNR